MNNSGFRWESGLVHSLTVGRLPRFSHSKKMGSFFQRFHITQLKSLKFFFALAFLRSSIQVHWSRESSPDLRTSVPSLIVFGSFCSFVGELARAIDLVILGSTHSRRYLVLTSLCQLMPGMGNPLALHDNFTVEPLRTVKLLLGCNEEITGGTGKNDIVFQLKVKNTQEKLH